MGPYDIQELRDLLCFLQIRNEALLAFKGLAVEPE